VAPEGVGLSGLGCLSGRLSQSFNEIVRNRFTRRELDAGFGGFEAKRREFLGMFGDGSRQKIYAALFAERRVARNDRFAYAKPRHVIGHNFLRFWQGAREE